ncbi:hypothetical protein ABEB36_014601 [Hypothenemus hampei]|uniref:Uncharacterized protein n=1 Tax=Hypothenemus hampei TaxID=57062 RepID=A0ABD1E2K3_HYPHA
MSSTEDIIERVGRNICLYQAHAIALREFSAEDLKYLPLCYLEKYVSSIELKSIWDKLPGSHKTSPILKLNLPCLKHFNDTSDSVTQFDGPPPPIKTCSTCGYPFFTPSGGSVRGWHFGILNVTLYRFLP